MGALKEKTYHFHEDQSRGQAAVGPLLFGGFHLIRWKIASSIGTATRKALFIPAAMLTQDGEETFITVNRWKTPEEDVRKVLEEIKGAASQLTKADDSRYPEKVIRNIPPRKSLMFLNGLKRSGGRQTTLKREVR